MSAHFASWDERTVDLAVEQFTVGLDHEDAATLDRLADRADLEEFENAFAAIHTGHLTDVEAPPTELLLRLERLGRQQVAGNGAPADSAAGRTATDSTAILAWTGWLAAAAAILMFAFPQTPTGSDPGEGRSALVARAGDLLEINWTATEDPAASGASGDVVWSAAEQRGYMRFRDLAANDPTESQYQLWIFDKTRADWEAKPVDGGVFDVSPGGEVVVAIDPKLDVRDAVLFAVTVEVPGGVVVSGRERLVLTAAL